MNYWTEIRHTARAQKYGEEAVKALKFGGVTGQNPKLLALRAAHHALKLQQIRRRCHCQFKGE